MSAGVEIFEHGQMSAPFERGRQFHPRNVAIAFAPLAQVNEVHVSRLERADPGGEATTRRPIRIGPVALTTHRPAQAFEMTPRQAMIEVRPLHIAQRGEIGITHPANSVIRWRVPPPSFVVPTASAKGAELASRVMP
jgi:hypothetical protein